MTAIVPEADATASEVRPGPSPAPTPVRGRATARPGRHRRPRGSRRAASSSPAASTPRRRLSLRVRITGVAMLVMVVVLALASVGLVQILEHALLRQTDDGLVADADGVAQVVRAGNAPRNGLPERYVQFVTAGGKIIGTNDVAEGMPLLVPRSRVDHVHAREIFSRADPAIGRLRVIEEPFAANGAVVLIVARPINQLSDTTRSLTHLLELGVPLLSIALGFVIWQMVGRALRPVEQVRATVSDISAKDLSRRVPSPGTGDEIDRLTATVNEMLARLEASVASEQRFIADASHELRSPIAAMRALLETTDLPPAAAMAGGVTPAGDASGRPDPAASSAPRPDGAIAAPVTAEAVSATSSRPAPIGAEPIGAEPSPASDGVGSPAPGADGRGGTVPAADRAAVLAALGRLQAMADQLLELAKEAGPVAPRRHAVDLDEIVLRQAATLRRTSALDIDSRAVSGGQVVGDGDQLGQLVENLATNAARHARSTVYFAVTEDDTEVTLVVADDGPGIPPADRTRVFERFTRLDHARSRADGGAGLGLAIVSRIVEQHEGTVVVDDTPGGGARFTVVLPIGPRPAT